MTNCFQVCFNFAFNFNLPRYSQRHGEGGQKCEPCSRGRVRRRGEAVQVDPIKPTLKAPGSERLKLKCDEPLSKFAFKFNWRRYKVVFVTGRGELAGSTG